MAKRIHPGELFVDVHAHHLERESTLRGWPPDWRRGGFWDVVRASPPCPLESVDLSMSGSLPWRDDATAAHCRGCASVRSGASGLRGRGEKTSTSTSSGAGDSARGREREAGSCRTCALADIESAAPPLRPAGATGSLRKALPDPEKPRTILTGRAKFQGRSSGSRAHGF